MTRLQQALTWADLGKAPWVIVGAETGNRVGKIVPQREWMDTFLNLCRPVFMKDGLIPVISEENMRREFPGEQS